MEKEHIVNLNSLKAVSDYKFPFDTKIEILNEEFKYYLIL